MTRPVVFGLVLGTLLGGWILVSTVVAPLAEDTPMVVGTMFGVVFLALAVPGFAARRRGGHFVDALEAGAIAGTITFALFLLLGILRVNLFLDIIRNRSDWREPRRGLRAERLPEPARVRQLRLRETDRRSSRWSASSPARSAARSAACSPASFDRHPDAATADCATADCRLSQRISSKTTLPSTTVSTDFSFLMPSSGTFAGSR